MMNFSSFFKIVHLEQNKNPSTHPNIIGCLLLYQLKFCSGKDICQAKYNGTSHTKKTSLQNRYQITIKALNNIVIINPVQRNLIDPLSHTGEKRVIKNVV